MENYLERLFSEEYIRSLLDPVVRDIMNRSVPQPLYRPRPGPSNADRQVPDRPIEGAPNSANLYQPQPPNVNNIVCDAQCNCQYGGPSVVRDVIPVPVFVPSPVMYVPEMYQQQQQPQPPSAPTLNVFLPQYGIVNFTARNSRDDESIAVNGSDTESAFSEDDYEEEQDVRQQSFVEHPLNFAMNRPAPVEYNFQIDYSAQNANLHFQSTRF